MFTVDVVSLRQFYASPTGRGAARRVATAIRRFWPACEKEVLAGLGFAVPFLGALAEDSDIALSLMPGAQGAVYWPPGGPNRTVLVDENSLPLPSESLNRLLVIHMIENSRRVGKTLEELWRVLTPGGRALLVVPNRSGIWAQAASTPFGCGQPFSIMQLGRRVTQKDFALIRYETALYMPPLNWRWLMTLAPAFELLGRFLLPESGGVIIMEIEKQLYGGIPEPVTVKEESAAFVPAAG